METSNVLILFVTSFIGCMCLLAVLVSTWFAVREGLRMVRKAQRKRKRAAYNEYYNIPAKGITPEQSADTVPGLAKATAITLVKNTGKTERRPSTTGDDTRQAA